MLEPEKSEQKDEPLLEAFKSRINSWTSEGVRKQNKIICYILAGITIGISGTLIYFLAIK